MYNWKRWNKSRRFTTIKIKSDIKYVIYTKDKEGNKNKESTKFLTHPCNYSDFYNNYNDSLDLLNIDSFNCLDKTDDIIEGIYTDEIFSYYEFSV